MKILLIYFALIVSSTSESYAQKPQEITVQILMPPGAITRVRFANDSSRIVPLTFINQGATDQIVKKNAIVTKPTFFKYSVINGENKHFKHSFLANPGDTVKLIFDKSGDINFEDESKKFVEDMIVLNFDSQIDSGKSVDLVEKNNLILDSLVQNNTLNISDAKSIKYFSEINYLFHSIGGLNDKVVYNDKLEKQIMNLDERFNDLKGVNAIELMDFFVKLVHLQTLKTNRTPSLINFIQVARQNVHNEKLLDNYIARMLQIFPEKSSLEYKEAIAYLGINENLNLPAEILNLNLISADGTPFRISDALNQLPIGGVLVLDFWASWCVPCIQEFPLLKQQKKDLAKLPIHFIPINMDKDRDDKKWRAIAAVHPELFQTRNYRAEDSVKKQLDSFFKINTIPRYIVINRQGLVMNFNLNRPSEKEFKTELLNYVK